MHSSGSECGGVLWTRRFCSTCTTKLKFCSNFVSLIWPSSLLQQQNARVRVDGTITGWLPPYVSNFFKDGDLSVPAALWRVQYDDAAVGEVLKRSIESRYFST
jgi:hypothetical protein